MGTVDLIILVVLAGFALYGLWFGLVHALGGIFGAIISFFIAAQLYQPFAASPFGALFGGNTNAGRVICFILLYVVLARLIGLAVWILDKVFKFVAIIPFLGLFNRLAGAVFGVIEGLILLAGIIYIVGKYPIAQSFAVALASSKIAVVLNWLVKVTEPLLPSYLAQLRSVFDVPVAKAADYIREYFKF